MEKEGKIKNQLFEEIKELRIKLKEAEETLNAVQSGKVDAIVVSGLQGEQVFTLTGAERAYRVLIETMNEGAASLNLEGTIIYCNQRFSEMTKTPLEKVIGIPMRQFIQASDLPVFDSLIKKGSRENGKGEVAFINNDGTVLPVLLSISALQKDKANIYGITVTDLTAQKHIEDELKRHRDHLEELVKERTSELETSNQKLRNEITERKRVEDALRESEERFRQIAESAEEWIWEINSNGLYTYASHVVEKILGYTSDEVVGKMHFYDFYPSDKREQMKKEAFEFFATKRMLVKYVNVNVHKNGSIILIETSGSPILDRRGALLGYRGADVDITEYRRLEEQLMQAQKMEAVGLLAGGIAHDFNNILSEIMGYGYLLQINMRSDDPLRKNVDQILLSADRAAEVARSLLAFSRKQILNPKPVNINGLVERVKKLLSRLIGEDIELNTNFTDKNVISMGDAGQIEQVLLNLATNARDAMPHGGHLTLDTQLVELDDAFIKDYGYGAPGMFAVISMSDTGCGMGKETMARIFEPFFTTKETGKGTGLGLSMAYGIIKQHNGYINVYSEPEKGTTFRIYIPAIQAPEEVIIEKAIEALPARGDETILVAEDNSDLRKLFSIVLQSYGYKVILAEDGEEAIKKFMDNKDKIQLVMLDMIMPKMSGKEAYDGIKKIRPDIKTLFSSGYTADRINMDGMLKEGFDFIMKPASPKELLRKIREVLDK